ncbi:MAG: hypothetical protein DWQ37_09575 [Planctomycetota bacterium]|nr:MAG: hypothetical protein DWQ37_09575 [Planctomycetota bacterium]
MDPRLSLMLDEPQRTFRPGELLAGQFFLEGVRPEEIRAVEVSVLWHTEGKGDEDMAVHFFERIDPDLDDVVDLRQPRRLSTVLPNSPLSYHGQIVKIRWCVRVRAFFWHGKELAAEVPFQLGAVPRPQEAPV